jgi:hypothetical protein
VFAAPLAFCLLDNDATNKKGGDRVVYQKRSRPTAVEVEVVFLLLLFFSEKEEDTVPMVSLYCGIEGFKRDAVRVPKKKTEMHRRPRPHPRPSFLSLSFSLCSFFHSALSAHSALSLY